MHKMFLLDHPLNLVSLKFYVFGGQMILIYILKYMCAQFLASCFHQIYYTYLFFFLAYFLVPNFIFFLIFLLLNEWWSNYHHGIGSLAQDLTLLLKFFLSLSSLLYLGCTYVVVHVSWRLVLSNKKKPQCPGLIPKGSNKKWYAFPCSHETIDFKVILITLRFYYKLS